MLICRRQWISRDHLKLLFQALKGFVLPMGGPKSYALTLGIGLLSTMLSGACFGSEVTHMYEQTTTPQNVGHLFGVLPIAAFEELDHYYTRMSKAIGNIRGTKKAPGVDRIYLPGERERLALVERRLRLGHVVPHPVGTEFRRVPTIVEILAARSSVQTAQPADADDWGNT